ncbi:ABC transporter permease [Acuticoccus kandeliae]|uniref:ABC transporter permease n=1 Tax=Acuticoccus kandeliae TaxID=2073160 RepID=UPI000D3E7123|nr:ABC transporter permease [Acuticoccus kandeliae]
MSAAIIKPGCARRISALLLALPSIAWLCFFVLAPLGFLVTISFWTATPFGTVAAFTTANYETIFQSSTYLGILIGTLRIAAITTILTLLVSYPVAWFLSRQAGRWKAIFMLLVFLPFWTSYVVRSFVWLPMLGRNGLLNAILLGIGIIDQPIDWFLYNEGAVYVGLVYAYVLFMVLPIYASLDRLDTSLFEAAADLGAPPFATFRKVILPLTLPGIVSGCVMVFLMSCGAYVTPQLLGGTSGMMYGNIIAAQFLNTSNWALGAALAVVLVVVVLAAMLLAGRRFGLQQIFMRAGH